MAELSCEMDFFLNDLKNPDYAVNYLRSVFAENDKRKLFRTLVFIAKAHDIKLRGKAEFFDETGEGYRYPLDYEEDD